jgi:putative ABC transport system substrate-binding protein
VIRRRTFIAGLGSAAVWPVVSRAQQSALPVIGYVYTGTAEGSGGDQAAAFRKGLSESGFIEGRNVSSSTGGRRTTSLRCRKWSPIWCAVGSR